MNKCLLFKQFLSSYLLNKEVNKLQQKALKERNSILQYVLLQQLISSQEFDYKLYRNN